MNFASDNVAGVAPEILEAIVSANQGVAMPYGEDRQSRELEARFDDVFQKEVGVMLVSTGTAANALALATVTPSYGAIFCRTGAHIEVSEGGAVERFSGARLVTIDGPGGKLDPGDLDRAIAAHDPAKRFSRPAAVSITQASEVGTVYRPEEVASIAEIAHRHGLKLHVDGARWANAVAALGCSPAEASWRAGVDVLSFGASKNGALAAEAVVFFDRGLMTGAAELRKRAGMLWSKHRFLAAQWHAYLDADLWLDLASRANAAALGIGRGLADCEAAQLLHPVDANEIFVRLPDDVLEGLEARQFGFYRRGGGVIRLVTSFSTSAADVEALVAATCELAGANSAANGAAPRP